MLRDHSGSAIGIPCGAEGGCQVWKQGSPSKPGLSPMKNLLSPEMVTFMGWGMPGGSQSLLLVLCPGIILGGLRRSNGYGGCNLD